jgi:hypothetical protein
LPDGPIVLMHALLRGMGRETECDILVRKTVPGQSKTVSAQGAPVFSECSVISAPASLPDGKYQVLFDGHVARVQREQGVWSTCEPVSRHR